jgi:hypothetical protein
MADLVNAVGHPLDTYGIRPGNAISPGFPASSWEMNCVYVTGSGTTLNSFIGIQIWSDTSLADGAIGVRNAEDGFIQKAPSDGQPVAVGDRAVIEDAESGVVLVALRGAILIEVNIFTSAAGPITSVPAARTAAQRLATRLLANLRS